VIITSGIVSQADLVLALEGAQLDILGRVADFNKHGSGLRAPVASHNGQRLVAPRPDGVLTTRTSHADSTRASCARRNCAGCSCLGFRLARHSAQSHM